MSLELAALLAAIQTARPIVREGTELVTTIRDGISAHNKRVKADLTAKLHSLEEKLESIGQVAEVAESYLKTSDNIGDLLHMSEELNQFVKDAEASLRDSRLPTHDRDWERVTSVYRRIGEARDAPQQVMLDRAEWYDERDKFQIADRMKAFSSAYERAKGFVEARKLDGVRSQLEQMIQPLDEARTLLSLTLYNSILSSLQHLKV